MKKKVQIIFLVIIILTINYKIVLADENTQQPNEAVHITIDHVNDSINTINSNIKDITNKIDQERKNYENTIDILKISLDESNNRNSQYLSFYGIVFTILTLVLTVLSIFAGTLSKKINKMKEDTQKYKQEIEKELKEINITKKKFEDDKEELLKTQDYIVEYQSKLKEEMESTIKIINGLKEVISMYDKSKDINSLKDGIESLSQELSNHISESDKNLEYIKNGEEDEKKILNMTLGEEE